MANVHMREIAREVKAFNRVIERIPEESWPIYTQDQDVQARFEKAGYRQGVDGKYVKAA